MAVTLYGRSGDSFQASIAAQRPAAAGDVECQWLGLPELEQVLCESAVCHDGAADLVLVPADWLPRLAAAGALCPLDRLLEAKPPSGWPDAWSDSFVDVVTFTGGPPSGSRVDTSASARKQLWGVPFHDGPPLLIYRRDLFESVDERQRYAAEFGEEMVPARTWAEFSRQAGWFTRPAESLFGTVLAGAPDGHNNVYDFVTQLRRHGGEVVDGRTPAFGGSAGLAALAWLRRHAVLQPATSPAAHDLDSVQSGAEFAAGRVALMVNWAGYALAAERPTSAVAGRVGVALAPRHDDGSPTVVVNAFWALAVAAGSASPTGPGTSCNAGCRRRGMSRRPWPGQRIHGSTWSDPRITALSDAFGLFEAAHRSSRPLPVIVELPLLVQILSDLVERVVWQGRDAEVELARAAEAATEVLGAN